MPKANKCQCIILPPIGLPRGGVPVLANQPLTAHHRVPPRRSKKVATAEIKLRLSVERRSSTFLTSPGRELDYTHLYQILGSWEWSSGLAVRGTDFASY